MRSVLRRITKWIARRSLLSVAQKYGGDAVPVDELMKLQRRLPGRNPLSPRAHEITASAQSLNNARLASLLKEETLGTWSLGPRSINYLEEAIERRRPRLVLEMGSGISTACLAVFVQNLAEDPALISIEQSEEAATATKARLQRAGLAGIASVVVRPMKAQRVLGRQTICYDLEGLSDLLRDRMIEFLLVDGPAGPAGTRFGTVPLCLPFMGDRSWFLLDDALREAELAIAREWAALPRVSVEGVLPWETGLLQGTVAQQNG